MNYCKRKEYLYILKKKLQNETNNKWSNFYTFLQGNNESLVKKNEILQNSCQKKYIDDEIGITSAKKQGEKEQNKLELYLHATEKNGTKKKKIILNSVKGIKMNDKAFMGKRTIRILEGVNDGKEDFSNKIYNKDKYDEGKTNRKDFNINANDLKGVNNEISSSGQSSNFTYNVPEIIDRFEGFSSDTIGKDSVIKGTNYDKIPTNNIVNYVFIDKSPRINCKEKRLTRNWNCNLNNVNVKQICIPDRRLQLCINGLIYVSNYYTDDLKTKLMDSINMEIELLLNKWDIKNKFNNTEFCNDFICSFADYGDIIKGTDMARIYYSIEVEKRLGHVFGVPNGKRERTLWWNRNRKDIWNELMSKFKDDKIINALRKCEKSSNFEEAPQFERWVQEWARESYGSRSKELKNLENKCKEEKGLIDEFGCSSGQECKNACGEYEKWIYKKRKECYVLSKKFDIEKNNEIYIQRASRDNVSNLLKKVCEEVNKTENDLGNNKYNNLCNCQKDRGFVCESGSKSESECSRMCTVYILWIKQKLIKYDVLSKKRNITKYIGKDALKGTIENDVNFLSEVCTEFNWIDFEKIFDLNYNTYKSICSCRATNNTKFVQLKMEESKQEQSTEDKKIDDVFKTGDNRELVFSQKGSSSTINLSYSVDDGSTGAESTGNTTNIGDIENTGISRSSSGDTYVEGNFAVNRSKNYDLENDGRINHQYFDASKNVEDGTVVNTGIITNVHDANKNENSIKRNKTIDDINWRYGFNSNKGALLHTETKYLKETCSAERKSKYDAPGSTNIYKEEEKDVQRHNFNRTNTSSVKEIMEEK
ncbi:duffy binding protein 2 [Plasmodium malariae]|uniref:Duffy binding protein 2 n=1 Tax=Plasmodium malariae TaxID=5858 RepID=A0A1A8X8Y8_PLAMA|nr:duffy binding protein 2 [Plasmodium malariae]